MVLALWAIVIAILIHSLFSWLFHVRNREEQKNLFVGFAEVMDRRSDLILQIAKNVTQEVGQEFFALKDYMREIRCDFVAKMDENSPIKSLDELVRDLISCEMNIEDIATNLRQIKSHTEDLAFALPDRGIEDDFPPFHDAPMK